MLIRASQDRCIEDGSRLFAQAAAWPVLTRYALMVPPRGPGDAGRTTTIAVRAGAVCIKRPQNDLTAGLPKRSR